MQKAFTDIQAKKGKIEEDDDSFVCCIMSHGNCDDKGKGYISCSDGEKFYLEDEAYEKLSSPKCAALFGKPKMFFVQACRGEDAEVVGTNRPWAPTDVAPSLVTHSDFLFCYATSPNMVAFRKPPQDPPLGSIYFIKLCMALEKYYCTMDIVTIVSHVQNALQATDEFKLTHNGESTRQCPQMVTTLRGPFFFNENALKLYENYIKKCLKDSK